MARRRHWPVQEVTIHHGTYDESRRTLLTTTFDANTRTYELTPAYTAPLFETDCAGPGWRHYLRSDGSAFQSKPDCISYTKRQN